MSAERNSLDAYTLGYFMSKQRVLIVDDEVAIASTLSQILNMRDYEARYAVSGADAVDTARDFRPDILLTDLTMPGMDGMEVIDRVRWMLPGCRAFLITGQAGFLDKTARFKDVRALQKPVPPEDLLDILGESKASGSDRTLRILVVEDQEIKRYSVTRWLLHNNFSVDAVETAAELQRTDLNGVDCILMDIGLPDGNGYDLCRRLRADSIDTPIIHFSATVAGKGAEEASRTSGADAFVASSIEPDDLVFIIRQKIQLRLLRDAVATNHD